jgi:Mn2+/Fe2+ NRAMP family transporter
MADPDHSVSACHHNYTIHRLRGWMALSKYVLATVLLPVSLIFLLMLANDRDLMGLHANRKGSNAAAIGVVAMVGLCGAAYGVDSFLRSARLI